MPLQQYTYNRISYYVDYRLKQFRSNTSCIKFVDFSDTLGDRILAKMIRENVVDWSKLNI